MGKPSGGSSRNCMEINGKVLDFRSILKEVEILGSSDMTWKERKDMQNRKVVQLGGKAPKQQRLPLSVARLQMKNQKIKEHKILQQEILCGYTAVNTVKRTTPKQHTEKRNQEKSILKSSQGRFKNGVLDVKHLLKNNQTYGDDERGGPPPINKGVKKKTKKKGGKKKGGGKKRH